MVCYILYESLIILSIILAVVLILFSFYRFWFLRKPKRDIPEGECIVSPANGKIIKIIDIEKKYSENHQIKKGLIGKVNVLVEDVAKSCYLIVIMMTPLNVHYQRAPFNGTVINVKHTKGKLMNAMLGAGNLNVALENEKNEILIKTRLGMIKVIQVAGFVARRTVSFVKKNQNIKKGQVIGIIRLGSQVCLVMPKMPGFELQIKEGQKVIDGETIIASKKLNRK